MELSEVVIGGIGIIFSVGMSVGTVRQFLKAYKEKVDVLEKKIATFSDCDSVIRRFLFMDDGTARYVPASSCLRSHEKQDKRLESIEEKLGEIYKEILTRLPDKKD